MKLTTKRKLDPVHQGIGLAVVALDWTEYALRRSSDAINRASEKLYEKRAGRHYMKYGPGRRPTQEEMQRYRKMASTIDKRGSLT